MYKAHYINPLKQNGAQEYDLLIEDDEGILPPARVSKSFKEGITERELEAAANQEIQNVIEQHGLNISTVEQIGVGELKVDKPVE